LITPHSLLQIQIVYILIHAFFADNHASLGSTQTLASQSVRRIITFSLFLYSSSDSHLGALNNVLDIRTASHIAVQLSPLLYWSIFLVPNLEIVSLNIL